MDNLTINEEYARKFQQHKEKQLKQKLKGWERKDYEKERNATCDKENEYESSDNESEDSEAELVNEKVKSKFLEVLLKLKDDSMTQSLKKLDKPIFDDSDFHDKRQKTKKEGKVGFSITDALIVDGQEEDEGNEDVYDVTYVPKEKQKDDKEKKEFIQKLEEDDEEDDDEGGFSFLKKKERETEIPEMDQKTNEEPKEQAIESLTLDEALKKSKIKTKDINLDLLQNIWGEEKIQDKNERFLRNYILSEAWLDNDENRINKKLLLIDKEDEEKDELYDNFEHAYNHRFEEEGGANITTYQRQLDDTFRVKDESRAKKRKEREKRKEEEKEKLKKEIRKEKEARVEEVMKKISKISAKDKLERLAQEMEGDSDFDMDKFDQKMNEIFDEDDIGKNEENYEDEMKDEEENFYPENDEDEQLWFYCDSCRKVIKENKIKYDCATCEDFTLCKSCFKGTQHPHKMKKDKVPVGCTPPENWKEILDQVNTKESSNELICTNCNSEIVNLHYFICEICTDVIICKTCRGIGKSVHPDHKLKRVKIETEGEETELKPEEKIKSILDSKLNTVVDDFIGKDIPSKFHYTKVEKDQHGLTNEMLLYLDDHVLQKFLPLKKLAPYNKDYTLNEKKREAMLRQFERMVEKKKRELFQLEETDKEIKEKNKETMKLLNKKVNREDYTDFKKKKRLETYGISQSTTS